MELYLDSTTSCVGTFDVGCMTITDEPDLLTPLLKYSIKKSYLYDETHRGL